MSGWGRIIALAAAALAACGRPAATPPAPDGELIVFGGGPGGAADACFACHGFRGEGDGLAPRLAGLPLGYLLKQLDDYAEDRRIHPDMNGPARRMPDAERLTIAAYYAAMGPAAPSIMPAAEVSDVFIGGDPSRGLPACAECHGADARGDGQAYPPLAGQPASYLRRQLLDWRQGKRWNDPRNVMSDVARRLTEAEIETLSAQLSRLPS